LCFNTVPVLSICYLASWSNKLALLWPDFDSQAEYGSGCIHAYVAVGKLPGKHLVVTTSSVPAFDCLIKYIPIACCLIVAMPSGKRETERKENAPVNTVPMPNSDGCVAMIFPAEQELWISCL
ncbi:hypothetical protein T09_7409, partial [Trichinella sp. T9]